MTYWFIAHAAWFVYTAKNSHFTTQTHKIRPGLRSLIRMTKNPSLHYNHKPSRSFQQDLRKHTKQISLLTSHHMLKIQSTCRSSPTLNQFTSTAGKTPYQLQKPSAAGLLTLSHGSKLRDHLNDKLRLNRHLCMQPHISKTYFWPLKAQGVKE